MTNSLTTRAFHHLDRKVSSLNSVLFFLCSALMGESGCERSRMVGGFKARGRSFATGVEAGVVQASTKENQMLQTAPWAKFLVCCWLRKTFQQTGGVFAGGVRPIDIPHATKPNFQNNDIDVPFLPFVMCHLSLVCLFPSPIFPTFFSSSSGLSCW